MKPGDRLERLAIPVLLSLIGLSLAVRAITAYGRAFDRDEFQFWYTAWMMSAHRMPGRDFAMPYGYSILIDWLRPLFSLFPDSTAPLFLSRAAIFVVGGLVLLLVYRIGRRLTDSRAAALLGVVLVTFQPQVIHRIPDVRWDSTNVLCVLAALLAVVGPAGRRSALLTGLALGLGVMSCAKVALAIPFVLGLGFLLHGRAWSRSLHLVFVAGAAPIALYVAIVEAAGLGPGYRQGFAHFLWMATEPSARVAPFPALAESFRTHPTAVLLWAVCAVAALASWRARPGDERASRAGRFVLVTTAYGVVYAATNPVFFAYNLVDLAPVLALAVPAAAAGWTARLGLQIARLSGLLGLMLAAGAARETVWSLPRSNAFQLRYLDYIRRAIRPDEKVFDLTGSHLGRAGPYHWQLVAVELPSYRSGKLFSVSEELRRERVSLIVRSFRLHWLPERDWEFIREHYVRVEPLLFYPGRLFAVSKGRSQRFEILLDGDYRFLSYRPEGTRIDGLPPGEKVFLTAGDHTLEFAESAKPSFALVYTTPEREANKLGSQLGDAAVPTEQ